MSPRPLLLQKALSLPLLFLLVLSKYLRLLPPAERTAVLLPLPRRRCRTGVCRALERRSKSEDHKTNTAQPVDTVVAHAYACSFVCGGEHGGTYVAGTIFSRNGHLVALLVAKVQSSSARTIVEDGSIVSSRNLGRAFRGCLALLTCPYLTLYYRAP